MEWLAFSFCKCWATSSLLACGSKFIFHFRTLSILSLYTLYLHHYHTHSLAFFLSIEKRDREQKICINILLICLSFIRLSHFSRFCEPPRNKKSRLHNHCAYPLFLMWIKMNIKRGKINKLPLFHNGANANETTTTKCLIRSKFSSRTRARIKSERKMYAFCYKCVHETKNEVE